MLLKNSLTLLSTIISFVQASDPPPLSENSTSNGATTFPNMILGDDGPADSATIGYNLNHISLLSSNLTATRAFYGKIIGMRHLFTYQASADYEIMYMGHAQGGKNGSGYQTGEELRREKQNMQGLIEFISLKVGHHS
jgi:lactoylglutathione lyase